MADVSDITFRWNVAEDAAPAAAFAASTIGGNRAYISHGEIQCGLSEDGEHWVPDLAERFAQDFADPGDRDMLVGRSADGKVVALLIVAWESTPRRSFAVIEDMAVDPDLRGQGIGGQLLAMAQKRIRDRGVDWVFLESGLQNEDAHRFFERAGFAMTSHVFARRLDQA